MIHLIAFMVRFRSHDNSDSRFFLHFLNEGKELGVCRHHYFYFLKMPGDYRCS